MNDKLCKQENQIRINVLSVTLSLLLIARLCN